MAHYRRFDEKLKREVTGEALTPVMRLPRRIWGGFVLAYLVAIIIMHLIFRMMSDEAIALTITIAIIMPFIIVLIFIEITRDMLTICEKGLLYGLEGWGFIFYSYDDIVVICKWDSSHFWMKKEEGLLAIFDIKSTFGMNNWRIIEKRWKDTYKTAITQMKKYLGDQWEEVYRPGIILRTADEFRTFISEYDKGKTPWVNWGE